MPQHLVAQQHADRSFAISIGRASLQSPQLQSAARRFKQQDDSLDEVQLRDELGISIDLERED